MTKSTLLTVLLTNIIVTKLNPRKDFEKEAQLELAESVREKGVLQPIIVRPTKKEGQYELVSGERRYRAAEFVGLKEIPVTVRILNDEEALEVQIIENLQRKDVHPMEEAIAFKRLIDTKKMTVPDIAKNIGKNGTYVAQRLKLTDLTPKFQKAFLDRKMTLDLALKVSKLTAEAQKEIWAEDNLDEEEEIELNDYTFRQYQHNLNNAPFDIKDTELNKKMGACVGCPHNTASNTLLFPEAATESKCLLVKCFEEKANASYLKELNKSIQDPAIVLVSLGYEPSEAVKKLIKEGHEVMVSGYSDNRPFEEIEKPIKMNFEDWFEEEGDNDESDKWNEDQYKKHTKWADEELVKYEKAVGSGKYLQAFVVDGDQKGTYVYISLNKKGSKAGDKKSDGGTVNAKAEITRLNLKEKRNEELDQEKVQQELNTLMQGIKTYPFCDKPLIKSELIAMNLALFQSLSHPFRTRYKKESGYKHEYGKDLMYQKLVKESETALQRNISRLTRLHVLDTCSPGKGSRPGTSDNNSIFYDIAFDINEVGAKKVEKAQMDIRAKRKDKLKSRIDQLKSNDKK